MKTMFYYAQCFNIPSKRCREVMGQTNEQNDLNYFPQTQVVNFPVLMVTPESGFLIVAAIYLYLPRAQL